MNCIKISRIWNCVHVPGRCSCDKTRLMSRLGAPPIRFAVCVWWFVCFFAICLVRRINYPDLFSWHCASGFFLLFLGSFLHHIFCFKHASCARIDNIISVFGSKVSVASFALHWQQPTQGLCLELPISVRNVSEREKKSVLVDVTFNTFAALQKNLITLLIELFTRFLIFRFREVS